MSTADPDSLSLRVALLNLARRMSRLGFLGGSWEWFSLYAGLLEIIGGGGGVGGLSVTIGGDGGGGMTAESCLRSVSSLPNKLKKSLKCSGTS